MTSIIKVDTIQTAAGGTPTAASLGISGTGKIGQIVEATTTTELETTSTSFVDSGFDVTITPTSTSSKILVMLDIGCVYGSAASNGAVGTIYRNDTTDLSGGVDIAHFSRVDSSNLFNTMYIQKLDSPNSTSAVKYTFYVRSRGGTTIKAPLNTSFNSFIAMEVLA